MWKKISLMVISIIGITLSAFALDNKLFAANETVYNAGGNVTGRVNIAPNGISGSNIGFTKGDKISMGINISGIDDTSSESVYHNEPLEVLLLMNRDYTDYGSDLCLPSLNTPCVQTSVNAWLSMTTKAIDNSSAGLTAASYKEGNNSIYFAEYKNSLLYNKTENLNNSLPMKSFSIIAPRNYTVVHSIMQFLKENPLDRNVETYKNHFNYNILSIDNSSKQKYNGFFISSMREVVKIPSYYPYDNLIDISTVGQQPDTAFYDECWSSSFYHENIEWIYSNLAITKNGGSAPGGSTLGGRNQPNIAINGTKKLIRPSAWITLTNSVFATSLGSQEGLAEIKEFILPENYGRMIDETASYDGMKVRLKNEGLTASFSKMQRSEIDTTELNKTSKDSEVFINANANVGSSADGINTVSVLVFQHNDITGNDDFKYYKPLEPAKGNGLYTFDTTGIPLGKYKIAIVNEVYNEYLAVPADSSLISDVKELEIVSPISNLNFTPSLNLIYNSNVNVGDNVGTISSSNGAGTPVYTLIADSALTSDVAKFEIGVDGKTIKVKGTALDAGTYYFKIQAQDSNGDPETPLEINAQITIGKATPAIAFNDTGKTVKTVVEAQTSWNETATSAPSTDEVKTTYDISGGDIGVITIDPSTGAITPTSSTAKGKVTIRATVDDNPTSGKDNYESASTTKEVIIIEGVDGTVTPDSASSDSIIPTFKATDANIKTGGKIATIKGINGFFDNGTSGTITYKYELKSGEDSTYFLINGSGSLTSNANLPVGSYHVTAIVSDNWSNKEIPITINVGQAAAEALKFYDLSDKITAITTQSAKLGEIGVTVFAEVKGSSNPNTIAYAIKDGSPTNVVTVHPSSGAITTQNAGTTIITATKKGVTGQADAVTELTFTVTTADQTFIYTDSSSNELAKNPDGTYQPYKQSGSEVEYKKAGTFQLYTSGSPTGSTVTYELKSGSPTDVISVDNNGSVTILNANTALQKNKVIVNATSVDPNGNYADKTIELPINIAKATPVISFKEITNVPNGDGSVQPVIVDQDISSNAGGVTVNDTQYIISVDSSFDSSVAWSNDGKTITYSYSEVEGIEVPLKVTKPGNRNFNNSVEATGKIYIVGQEENMLEVSTPGKIVYGDTFTIRSLQDDSSSTNVNYVFTLSDGTYIKENTQTNNQMSFNAIKASGTNEIEIKVDRTADGEMPLSKSIKVKVVPKDITIQLDPKTRKVGESNPSFTYQDFTSKLVSWNGVKDVIQPSDIKITTTAIATSPVGSYPISLDINHLNTIYPNYKFKVSNSTLTISEDSIGNDWYHMEKKDATSYTANTWVNQDVLVKPDHKEYTKLSLNKQVWEDALSVSVEGKTSLTFYMKNASNAITGSKIETILIDKTKPKVTSIKGKDTKSSPVEKFINAVTFNTFFKPGVTIEILAEDVKVNSTIENSGISNISYKLYEKVSNELIEEKNGVSTGSLTFKIQEPGVYKVCAIATDKAGNQSVESCEEVEVKKIDVDVDDDGKNDFNDPDNDGCPDVNIVWKNTDNTWTKLNTDRNDDGIPDMNIDSDGDGIADLNLDTDKDGKPDLNLVSLTKAQWKPTICVTTQLEEYCTGTSAKAVINVDLDKDNIPDINIDTNGNMKADINITKPNDTKPWLNITSKHSSWKPEKNYTFEGFTYDTEDTWKAVLNVDSDKDGRPDLNIDFDGDGKPDINIDADGNNIPETDIDSDGDGIPDINIDTDKDGKADDNIVEIKEWKPETNGSKDGFDFDTMTVPNGKDQLEDNDVVVTKPDGVFLPNFALKVDKVTDIVSEVVKNDIIRKSNGQVINEIYDVKLLKDNVQVQPDGKLQIKLPLLNNLKNPQLVIEQADGTYLKVKPEIRDGFMYYESDFLGKVSVVIDGETQKPEPIDPTPDSKEPTVDPNEPTPDSGGSVEEEVKKPTTSVKGTYYGGTNTGDSTNMISLFLFISVSFWLVVIVAQRKRES